MYDAVDPVFLNIIYTIVGGSLTLLFMWIGCRVFSHIVSFNVGEEMAKGNVAVGIMMGGIFVGIGIAMGLVIGMGLN